MSSGWTSVRRPSCRAMACMTNEAIMRPKPTSQTFWRRMWPTSLRRMLWSAGAYSTPIRWSTLVNALEKEAAMAST